VKNVFYVLIFIINYYYFIVSVSHVFDSTFTSVFIYCTCLTCFNVFIIYSTFFYICG
jgi:hypothetical protein